MFAAIPASVDHVGVGATRNWATGCDVKPEGAVRKRTWSKRNKTRDKLIDQKAPAKMRSNCTRCERKPG